jgi:hypothetical protein
VERKASVRPYIRKIEVAGSSRRSASRLACGIRPPEFVM